MRTAAALIVLALGAHSAYAQPMAARIINVQVQGVDQVITIDRGTAQGVQAGWHGRLENPNGGVIPHSDFVILRAAKRACVAKVRLDAELLMRGALHVVLEPPPVPTR